ncbi:hypothetical protein Gotri_019158 [Gossypium trilobum]|uniref:MULE transposase domain-containing protein n=1 Tax=Gossypium trilobum TaxID=34281 RepID=A0A7J9ECP4_9ROSI|nr:hypothetical protein [Gossypium trilobum]
MLWDYADELILKNPGNTIKMAVNRVRLESPPHFKRLYVCFGALKRGRKEGCRPILGLDGCFLKGPFKGLLLAVVAKDGNNQMYPVAWAIVEGECIDSWRGSGNKKNKNCISLMKVLQRICSLRFQKLGPRLFKGYTRCQIL